MNDTKPTLPQVEEALKQLEMFLLTSYDGTELEMLCGMYAKAYVWKLRLMK
jgi:hypothetical protein